MDINRSAVVTYSHLFIVDICPTNLASQGLLFLQKIAPKLLHCTLFVIRFANRITDFYELFPAVWACLVVLPPLNRAFHTKRMITGKDCDVPLLSLTQTNRTIIFLVLR